MALTQARYDELIDVPRGVWDPTEGAHDRHGERPYWAVRGLEVHWTGSGGDLLDHDDTGSELLSFERYHEVSKGWYDLFYNVALDSQENTYEGRDITIPSQSNLRDWMTFLIVLGPDQEDAIRGDLADLFARGIYRAWGAVDPDRSPSNLRFHSERSSTGCPGTQIATIIHRLRGGWVPPGAEEAPFMSWTDQRPPENLGGFAEAAQAAEKGFINNDSPERVASRSVVSVVATRLDDRARTREDRIKAQADAIAAKLEALERKVSELDEVGNNIEVDAQVLDAIVTEIIQRLAE